MRAITFWDQSLFGFPFWYKIKTSLIEYLSFTTIEIYSLDLFPKKNKRNLMSCNFLFTFNVHFFDDNDDESFLVGVHSC